MNRQWFAAVGTRRLLAAMMALMALAAMTVGARLASASAGVILNNPGCTANTLAPNDDGSTDAVDIGFPVNFFGQTYNQLYVNNNGNVTFGSSLGDFTPFGLTGDVDIPIIAPFFADVDTTGVATEDGGGGDGDTPSPTPTEPSGPGENPVTSNPVTYGMTTYNGHPAFCVNWVGVGYFASHTDKLDNFQLLLVDEAATDNATDPTSGDFDIVFNYGSMQWEVGDADNGIDGLGGSSGDSGDDSEPPACAAAGYSNGLPGDDNVSYELPGSLQCGALIDGGPDALGSGSSSGVLGRYTYQARAGAPPQPVDSPTPTESATVTPTPTDTESVSPTPTDTESVTPTPTDTESVTPTPTETVTTPSLLPVDITGLTARDNGDGTMTAYARLVLAGTSTGVPGEPLVFTTDGGQSGHARLAAVAASNGARPANARPHDQTFTSITGSNGQASATMPLNSTAQSLAVDFAGDHQYAPATSRIDSVGTVLSSPDNGPPPPVGPSPTPTPTATETGVAPPPTSQPTRTPPATSTPHPTPSHTVSKPTPSAKATKSVPSAQPTHTGVLGLSTTRPNGQNNGHGGGQSAQNNGSPSTTTPSAAAAPTAKPATSSAPTHHHVLAAGAAPLAGVTPSPSHQVVRPPTKPAASHTAGDTAFGRALGDLRQVDFSPGKVGENAAVVLAATLIVLFPSELLNKTLHENYEEITGWFAPVTRRLRRREKKPRPRRAWRTTLSAVSFLAASSAIYGIGQPDFGFNTETLRVILGVGIGLALLSIGGNHAAISFARRRYHAEGQHALRHGTLFVAIACVLISRATHFEPGYTYGLVAGFVLDRQLGQRREARAVLSLSGYLLVMAIAGWLLLAPARSWLEHSEGFWPDLSVDVCTALTVEGLTGLVLALLPLRFMEGERLVKAGKLLWAATYGAVLFVFFQLVVDPSFVHRSEDPVPLVTWLSMCVGFGAVSVAFWAYFWRRHRGEEEEEAAEPGKDHGPSAEGTGVIDLTDAPAPPPQRQSSESLLRPSKTE